METPYGIDVCWNSCILDRFVLFGSTRSEVEHNSVAVECAMAAARWSHGDGNGHPYPPLHCRDARGPLRCVGLPPDLQCASLAPPAVNRKHRGIVAVLILNGTWIHLVHRSARRKAFVRMTSVMMARTRTFAVKAARTKRTSRPPTPMRRVISDTWR